MESRKELAHIALIILILTSAIPINSQMEVKVESMFLSANHTAYGLSTTSDGDERRERRDVRGNDTVAGHPDDRALLETLSPSGTLTESQLFSVLNAESRNIYFNLNPERKALAIQLASQNSYQDKNLAVKEAQRRTIKHQYQLRH